MELGNYSNEDNFKEVLNKRNEGESSNCGEPLRRVNKMDHHGTINKIKKTHLLSRKLLE